MKNFIKQKLNEYWANWEDEPTESPLKDELENLLIGNKSMRDIVLSLKDIEDKYADEYADFLGDSYGVIDAIKKLIPHQLKSVYNDMHPTLTEDKPATELDINFTFNNGRFNKEGHNTIYMDGEPIVDFGVGGIGQIKVGDKIFNNALFLQGGFNASLQGRGYGTLGLKAIFKKLPKIENILLQCYDTACPFWKKMGGVEVNSKEMDGGHKLRTLVVTKNGFDNKIGI